MRLPKSKRATKLTKPAASRKTADKFLLKLYVAGTSRRSREAILRVREFCAGQAKGSWSLEVIDIYQEPARARAGQILATPTLVKESPRPVRRLIGSLSKPSRLLIGLGLEGSDPTVA